MAFRGTWEVSSVTGWSVVQRVFAVDGDILGAG